MSRRSFDDTGLKTCMGKCGEELPATDAYFDRDAVRKDGLKSVCKSCRAREREVSRYDKVDERVRALDERSLKLLEVLSRKGSDVPHVAEIYQAIMHAYEGAGGFAAHFMAQYLMAQPGSTTRTRMLEIVSRLAVQVTQSGAAQIPVDIMNDEDLQIAFEAGVKRYVPRLASNDDGEIKETA